MKKLLILTLLSVLTACGMSYTLTKPAEVNQIPIINPSKAQIVFIRPRSGGFGMENFSAQIIDITNNDEKILGSLAVLRKFVIEYEPGEYTLFSTDYATRGHIMKMNVVAGKRYYVLVRPIYGNGYQLRPLKHRQNYNYSYANPMFSQWLSSTILHTKTEELDQWNADNHSKVLKMKAKAWEEWEVKSEEQQLELTLLPEDAIEK